MSNSGEKKGQAVGSLSLICLQAMARLMTGRFPERVVTLYLYYTLGLSETAVVASSAK